MDLHLKGRVAAIAAASAGLGFASALTLAQEGCHVAICGRREEKLQAAAQAIRDETGVDVLPLTLDMREPDAATRFR